MPCTLITYWNPDSETPLIVGANRDEDLDRPAEPYAMRENGIYCPLDVRGGTWLGMNNHGVFCSLTNLDMPHIKGLSSRGYLVYNPLLNNSVSEGFITIAKMLHNNKYNSFNLFLVDKLKFIIIFYKDDKNISIKTADPGLHIATRWGIDTWDIPRCQYIKDNFNQKPLKEILSYHGDGSIESGVCVHVPEENYATRSSCIIKADKDWETFNVEHTFDSPCVTSVWDKKVLDLC